MKITSSFNKEIDIKNRKILIYGAGNYGAIAKLALETIGIKVDFFVDRDFEKKTYLGIECIAPDALCKHIDDIVIIASLNYFYDILAYCQSIGMNHIYDMEDLMHVPVNENVLSEYARDEKNNPEKYHNVVEENFKDKIIINHIEIVITERCTLCCKDCANLMQYYSHPDNLDIDNCIETFNRLLSCVDNVLELRILGGEPFIVRDINRLLDCYAKNSKIKRITIYTNSTIVPNKEVVRSLKHEKISVHMSNYGDVSKKLNMLDDLFNEQGIKHYIHDYELWNDIGDVSYRNYSRNVVEKIYSSCVMANCLTFYRGKLYRCPRAAHGEQLGFFNNNAGEIVDFQTFEGTKEKREEVANFLTKDEPINACNYCNGSSINSRKIAPAIQK